VIITHLAGVPLPVWQHASGVHAQALSVRSCRGGPSQERPGLPHARHNRLQMAPMDPPGHSGSPQPSGWHLCENMFKKGQKCQTIRRGGCKKSEKQQRNTKVRGGGGVGAPCHQSMCPLWPMEHPTPQQLDAS